MQTIIEAAQSTYRRDLGDGLVLRWSTAEDTASLLQLVGHVFRRGENAPPNANTMSIVARLMRGDYPLMGQGDFAVIEDTSRDGKPLVACTCLWRQRWEYDGIPFGLGRPEFVGTDPAYRNRGLIRALFEVIHARSEAEGQLMQAITGIAYFYRQFGYEYALQLEAGRTTYLSLIAKLKEKASRLRIGAGDSSVDGKEMDMGPLVTRAHRDKVAGYVDKGVAEGAQLVLDGRGCKGTEDGFFLGASLFDHVTPAMTVYKDEIFGPVLIVLRVKTLDEAIRMINANPYANGTAVFTRSGGAARKFEREIEVGMVGVNVPIPVPIAFFSFGGWRNSLFGDQHVHGMEGVRFYTRGKVVTTRWPDANALPQGFNMPTLG